jgi:hypothetical protein
VRKAARRRYEVRRGGIDLSVTILLNVGLFGVLVHWRPIAHERSQPRQVEVSRDIGMANERGDAIATDQTQAALVKLIHAGVGKDGPRIRLVRLDRLGSAREARRTW